MLIALKKVKAFRFFVDPGYILANNKINIKPLSLLRNSGIVLTNNVTKDIVKIISPLENREILLKGTPEKNTCQEGGFLNFLKSLLSVGLPLIKSVLAPLAKIVLVPLGLTATPSATDAAIQ